MTRDEIKRLIQGAIATVPTAFDDRLKLDLGVMADRVEWWVGHLPPGGKMVIKVAAAIGEGPDLSDDEWPQFNVIDNSGDAVRCHKNGGRGYVNDTMQAYPPHDLQVWDLMEARRYDEAQALLDRVYRPLRALKIKFASRSGGYRIHKGMMAIMGRSMGGPRPPTLPLDEQEMAELCGLMVGFGWPVPTH